jgi:hypothetical protein
MGSCPKVREIGAISGSCREAGPFFDGSVKYYVNISVKFQRTFFCEKSGKSPEDFHRRKA